MTLCDAHEDFVESVNDIKKDVKGLVSEVAKFKVYIGFIGVIFIIVAPVITAVIIRWIK